MDKRLLFTTVMMLSLYGLAAAQENTPPEEGAVVAIQPQFTFFDSKLFDSRLSKELDSGRTKVEVDVTGRIPLSNIPGRMDRWMTEVAETGSVEIRQAEPEVRTRSLFALIPIIFSAFQKISEERLYSPAKNYDAAILYKKDANGDVLISKIVFTRKKP